MIVFVPAHDQPTEANRAVAERIVGPTDIALLADDASRDALIKSLAQDDGPLFVMSHGNKKSVLGQSRVPAFTGHDCSCLNGRPVFAYACWTAVDLGLEARERGSIWWGYIAEAIPPDERPTFTDLFAQIFGVIKAGFWLRKTPEECHLLLAQIESMCQAAARHVAWLYKQDASLKVTEVYLALRWLWSRLSVSIPGEMVLYQLPAPTLFWNDIELL